jgi:hypothetical protein
VRAAFVDSSCLVAIAMGERPARKLSARLEAFDVLLASGLLEAELRCALARERVEADPRELLEPLSWVLPDRQLGAEIERVLAGGYLRGADVWHLACALYVEPSPSELVFLTLDHAQGEAAARLGFPAV